MFRLDSDPGADAQGHIALLGINEHFRLKFEVLFADIPGNGVRILIFNLDNLAINVEAHLFDLSNNLCQNGETMSVLPHCSFLPETPATLLQEPP